MLVCLALAACLAASGEAFAPTPPHRAALGPHAANKASLRLPAARRGRAMGLRMAGESLDDELAKAFEREKANRQQEAETKKEMDKIFKDAQDDLKNLAQSELDKFKEEAEEIMMQREEEWEAMGNKEAASFLGKVDSLAEEFLKKTGRNVEDELDEFAELERYLGPQVVAIIGDKSPLRDELEKKLTENPSLTMSSCNKLLETRGMTIEETDTLVFCGDGEPLDRYTVERLIGRALKLRRVLCVSSVGTERANLFPFSLQNALTGALDKKRGVELGIVELSKKRGFAYTLMRIGKLSKPSSESGLGGVKIAPGDQMSEDIAVDIAAEGVMQSLMLQPTALNGSYSVVGAKQGDWDDEFLKLDGPEVYRKPLSGVSADACREWVQNSWSTRWGKPGSGLTTPVRIEQTKLGVQLVFTPTKSTFVSFKEEKAMEKAREKGDEDDKMKIKGKATGKDMEGGLEFVVEDSPSPRIRVKRCNMAEGTVVKETSEGIILASIDKDLKAWASENKK